VRQNATMGGDGRAETRVTARPRGSRDTPGAAAVPPVTLEAVLERITYANEETGYTVARVATPRSDDLLTVVGALLGAQPGESLRLRGRWRTHPQYGRQLEVESFETVLPATIQGIRRYLGSGLIKGIGPRMAERIVDHFGVDTLRIIEEEPARLAEVHGLGPKRTARIGEAWEAQRAIKEVMVFLQGVGVSTSIAVRIYKHYGDHAVQTVRERPYQLAADVWGIGFKTADTIARSLGIPHDSPDRVKAGLRHALSEAAEDGHCFLPDDKLTAKAADILGVDPALVHKCLEELVGEGGVVAEEVERPGSRGPLLDPDGQDGPSGTARGVYLVPFHKAEEALAGGLKRLLRAPAGRLPAFRHCDWDAAFAWLARRTGMALEPEQQAAVRLALTEQVAVLTGGPGCGKSYTVRAVVTLAQAKQARVILAAPTGRAAKRLSELAGAPAATLHRLLQLRPGGEPAFDRDRPLEADLVVVDETSMLDVLLANKLVRAVPPGAHLLLVGDADQLPSVGAGEVLRDLLAAGTIPSVRLTRVFRQAQESGIVTNAHRVNAGQYPRTRGLPDFFHFQEEDPEAVAELVVDVVANRIPRRFGLNPRRDVQVLAPMHRGPAGAGTLNQLLQEALTPPRPGLPERRAGGRVYRVGDKVMQVRNNYDKGEHGVFNGAVGVVTAMNLEEQELEVLLDEDERVTYAFDELDELTHAYAVSVHRAQGSEYPCVVVPVTMSAWMMLQRNLLYTAITRARSLVVLVGSARALARAVRTPGAGRHTALAQRLRRLAG
jgi:exodeoxyribonuclease V alpha subunit